jgi:CRISPR-associated endonuclease Cas1/group II intron reverse transcriptase/maturase
MRADKPPNRSLFVDHHLYAAWELVRRGSPSAGVDGVTVELFAGVVGEQIRLLQKQLRWEKYRASPAKGFYLAKKSGGRRLIGLPTVSDRLVQRYLLQAIYPALDRALSPASFAYRPGYSTHLAVERVMTFYCDFPAWVVKTDIQQFFDRLCWALLLHQLEQLRLPPVLVQLIEQQLRSGIVLDRRYVPMNQGVLQGGVLSGALANLYLSEFDRRCLAAGLPLVRYGDDCLIVCPGWTEANRALSLIEDWLAEIYLAVQPEKTQIFAPDESFVFLGYQFAAGTVTPPERSRPAIEAAKSRLRPPASRPPQVCSLVKAPRRSTSTSPDHYWREPMTTLYVTDQGAYVRVQHKQFQVFHEQELKISVPVNRVTHIVLFGCSNLSHGAVSLCLRHKIPVLYLSSNGRYFGQLQTTGQAQVKYLIHQVQRSFDLDFTRNQARSIVLAKLHNSRILLQRLNRRRPTETATQAIAALAQLIEQAAVADSVEALLGYEGQGANLYFRAYATLLKGSFEFERRTRRPPTDPVNSLLSLGYTLLTQNIHSMVEVSGLHTHFGNLHTPRDNHPALVSDLTEEFRALVVDSLVAYLVNSSIFKPEDFTPPDERGGVYLHPDGLKRFLKHWEDRLLTQVMHPHSGYKVNHRRCFELQVWEYIACLVGDRAMYRPMQWDK